MIAKTLRSALFIRRNLVGKPILLVLVLITHLSSFGQVENENLDSTSNMVYYHEDLNLKFVTNRKFSSLTIDNDELPASIDWNSNDNNNIGLGFSYKWLSLNLLANFKAINNDDSIFGKTNSLALLGNVYTKKLGFDAYLISTEGFYLSNPQSWNPNWMSPDAYPNNPGMRISTVGVNGLYIFNGERFSLKSTVILNERQKQSAGSAVLGGYVSFLNMDTDTSSLLPFQADEEYEYAIDIRNASYSNLGVLGGYAHNFIIKKYFFLSILGAVGLDAQSANINTAREDFNNEDRETGSAKVIVRFAFGYSGERVFGAFTGFADTNGLGSSLNYGYGFARFTFGYRIKNFNFSLKKKA